MYDDVVSTGSLAAASFETVGYAYQEVIVSSLGDMIIELAVLMFVIAFGYTVFSFATGGRAKDFLWFLVGPAVFFFLVFYQTEAGGALWQFGNFDDMANGEDSVATYLDQPRDAYSVSWAFHRYNKFISSMSRELIKVITAFDSRTVQVSFGRRQQIAEEFSQAEIQNSGLRDLVHNYAVGHECMEGMDSIREIIARRRERSTYLAQDLSQNQLDAANAYFNRIVSVEPSSPAGGYLLDTLFTRMRSSTDDPNRIVGRYCGELELTPRGTIPDRTQVGDVIPPAGPAEQQRLLTATCAEIWCWTSLGIYQEANDMMGREMNEIEAEVRQNPNIVGTYDLEVQLMLDIRDKTSPYDDSTVLAPLGDDISAVPTVISSIMLRNAINSRAQNNRLDTFAANTNFETGGATRSTDSPTETARKQYALNAADYQVSTGLKYDIYFLLMQMPYIQGIILYGLAALFPFFCVVAVFPGYHGTIIKFFLLWTWAKSWDVGWAFVMMADELLWHMMPHFAHFDPTNDRNHGPATMLEAAFSNDPTYSLSTYYMLVSSMVIAVPVLTANAILGGASVMGEISTAMGQKLSQGLAGRMMKSRGMQGVTAQGIGNEGVRLNQGLRDRRHQNNTGAVY